MATSTPTEKEKLQSQMGNRLYSLRKKDGLNQERMAECLSIDVKTYQRYEHGERCMDAYLVNKVCDHFGISTDELLNGEKTATLSDANSLLAQLDQAQQEFMLQQMQGLIMLNHSKKSA